MSKYHTFEQIYEIDPQRREVKIPKKFQVFELGEFGKMTPFHGEVPDGSTVEHHDVPVVLR